MTSACMNDDTKQYLIAEIEKQVTDTDKAQILGEFIDALPQCSVSDVKRGKKGERKLTAYNIYIGNCIKTTGKSMKDCVVSWREEKKKKQGV